jgi:uncharacterized protein (TIGR02246 family)
MFERYTERARRVLFFARYETSQLGSLAIGTEHLLLGLIRESKGLIGRIFARHNVSVGSIRKEIEARTVVREKVPTAVEIPFSREAKRVLQAAAEESDRLMHDYIGLEHLLLGILREERCVAAQILMKQGLRLDTVRTDIVELLNEPVAPQPVSDLTRCCFCGEPLSPQDAAALVIYPRPGSEGSRMHYTHRQCLRIREPPGVRLIIDVDDEDTDRDAGLPSNPDDEAIRRIVASWHEATAVGDIERILPLMADDVVFLVAGKPPMRGKQQFGDGLAALLEDHTIQSSGEIQELRISGDLAYCWTALTVTVTPRRGAPNRRTGYTLTVFRKQPDGAWVLSRDANLLGTE